jgi:hypothetical protein
MKPEDSLLPQEPKPNKNTKQKNPQRTNSTPRNNSKSRTRKETGI